MELLLILTMSAHLNEIDLANLTEMLTKDFINEYNKPLLTLQSSCLAFSKKTHDDDFVTP